MECIQLTENKICKKGINTREHKDRENMGSQEQVEGLTLNKENIFSMHPGGKRSV